MKKEMKPQAIPNIVRHPPHATALHASTDADPTTKLEMARTTSSAYGLLFASFLTLSVLTGMITINRDLRVTD
jgi:hypothetical protein